MKQLEFENLCRGASLELGLVDAGALGEGFSVAFNNVLFETAFREDRESFLLMAELGAVAEQDRASVLENLLTMQLLTWDRPGVRFGFNPARRTVLLCMEARFGPQCSNAWLAGLIRSVARQALAWRNSLLAGKVDAPERMDGRGGMAFADFLGQRR